jgi:hypothetical protein
MNSESRRSPRRICLSIHTRALEILRNGPATMLTVEALRIAKEEYDAKWKRPAPAAK